MHHTDKQPAPTNQITKTAFNQHKIQPQVEFFFFFFFFFCADCILQQNQRILEFTSDFMLSTNNFIILHVLYTCSTRAVNSQQPRTQLNYGLKCVADFRNLYKICNFKQCVWDIFSGGRLYIGRHAILCTGKSYKPTLILHPPPTHTSRP